MSLHCLAMLQPRCDPVPCPEFAGPPGICVCANGYDGIPDWDDNNNVWLHECVRDHLDNVTNPVCMPPLSRHALPSSSMCRRADPRKVPLSCHLSCLTPCPRVYRTTRARARGRTLTREHSASRTRTSTGSRARSMSPRDTHARR